MPRTVTGWLVAVLLLASGLSAAGTESQPGTDGDDPSALSRAVTVAGTGMRVSGCDALDVYEGPSELGEVSLRWRRPASRSAWLHREFDRVVRRFDGDLWRAFIELGGGLRQSAGGVVVAARLTDELVECGSFALPVLEVDEVLGAFDPRDQRHLDDAAEPLADEGLDSDDPELAAILAAGESALEGLAASFELTVEGVTDRSLGCPAWAFVESRRVDFDCRSQRGFVELRYADPALEPTAEQVVPRLLARRGLKSVDGLRRGARERLEEQADRLARRGPYHYRGHFTGEVTFHRGTEALFLTPVFVVEAAVAANPAE